MKRTSLAAALAAISTSALLAACGGDDGDEPAPAADPTEVPSSATASIAAVVAFAKALMSSETNEPLSMTNVGDAPVSDTDEPQSL
jgi:uncharacterized protein YdeI (BOF family)